MLPVFINLFFELLAISFHTKNKFRVQKVSENKNITKYVLINFCFINL